MKVGDNKQKSLKSCVGLQLQSKAKGLMETLCCSFYRQTHKSPPHTSLSAPEGGEKRSVSCAHQSVPLQSITKIPQFIAVKLKREPGGCGCLL